MTDIRPRIEGPLDWRGVQMRKCADWLVTFDASERAELERATAGVRHKPIAEIERVDFSLPTLAPKLDRARHEIIEGRGFAVLRGIDVGSHDHESLGRMYWGIGTHFGDALCQNPNGHLLGHVTDIGASVDNPDQRGYQSSDALPFHTDVAADIVGLFCLRPALQGGASSIVSGVAMYNEIRERAPELLELLCEPMHWDRRGEVPPGCDPWYQLPVFSHHAGHLLVAFIRRFIVSAERHAGVPNLSSDQLAALDLLQDLAADPALHLAMDFQPGDIQLINNHAVLHSRQGYVDHADAHSKRHLLRLWLAAEDGWDLPTGFWQRYPGRTVSGRPAGVSLEHTVPQASLDPLAV